MTPFDERFADRVRAVFDAYAEPVDEAALARLQEALNSPAPDAPLTSAAPTLNGRAPDRAARPPEASPRGRRGLRKTWPLGAAGLALLAALGVWILQPSGPAAPSPEANRPALAEAPAPPALAPAGPEASSPPATPRLSPPPGGSEAWARGAAPSPEALAPRRPPATFAARVDQRAPPAPPGPAPSEAPAERVAEAAPDPESSPALAPSEGIALAEPVPSAPALTRPPRGLDPFPVSRAEAASPGAPFRVVVGTAAVVARGQIAEGASLSAGVVGDRALGRGVRVSGGALAAYNRLSLQAPASDFFASTGGAAGRGLDGPVEVTERTDLATLALEIPLDVTLDLAASRRGRLRAGVGLTSALYLAQTFETEGRTLTLRAPTPTEPMPTLSATPFARREEPGALSRLDLGRQLNLSLGWDGRPLGVEALVRLPLGGLTSRDLPLVMAGVRATYALP